jgi:transposase
MTKKRLKKSNQPKSIKLSNEQVETICQKLTGSNLDDETREFVIGLINSNKWLIEQLEQGKITIKKLRKIFGVTTEKNHKSKDRKDKANGKNTESNKPKPGHGRNHSDEYNGAEEIEVNHDTLKPGDDCPIEECNGKLYNAEPGVVINITGSPIAAAKKYIIEKLRCALCGELFVAEAPEGMDPKKKYDESFAAMLMINRYFAAVPFYRQEQLQLMLGVPLPASTQWEILKSYEPVLEYVYDALVKDAANGKGFYIDDTFARILEHINQRTKDGKKSYKCFTTGIISVNDNHRSVIFITNKDTAGKTFSPIWKHRDESLDQPFIMADALTANIPSDIKDNLYIMCYCLVHARRNFYDLGEGYDDLADVALDLIGKIYDNEAATKALNVEERLRYHQTHSQPVMDELKIHLLKYQALFEPNGAAGKSINYMLKRWTELTQFLRYVGVPIDNNEDERALKLVIRNRNNSLFYKTYSSALLSGYMQSLIYSSAQNNINPFNYLKAILVHKKEVQENPTQWLPWNYHKSLQILEEGKACHEGANRVA